MPYYRGDAYGGRGGNYYRGDPFIGGLIAGAAGKLAGKAVRWVAGKVGGAAARTAPIVAPIIRDAAPGVVGGAIGYAAGRQSMPSIPQLGPMSPMAGPDIVWTKRRKMNPLNPKALRRALRRAEGFEKFAARTVNAMYRVIDGRKVRTYKKKSRG